MKKLSQKQKTIIAVAAACLILLVSVVITVVTVRHRAQKQEYERLSMEESILALSSLSESSTEEVTESTSTPTTEEPTTQKTPVTTEKKKDKPKAETTKNEGNGNKGNKVPHALYAIRPPIENWAFSANGGSFRYVKGEVKNVREVDGGYDIDVYVTVTRDERGMLPDYIEPQEGHIKFYIEDMSGEYVGNYTIVTKVLNQGETDTAFVTVHLPSNQKSYFISFSYPS